MRTAGKYVYLVNLYVPRHEYTPSAKAGALGAIGRKGQKHKEDLWSETVASFSDDTNASIPWLSVKESGIHIGPHFYNFPVIIIPAWLSISEPVSG